MLKIASQAADCTLGSLSLKLLQIGTIRLSKNYVFFYTLDHKKRTYIPLVQGHTDSTQAKQARASTRALTPLLSQLLKNNDPHADALHVTLGSQILNVLLHLLVCAHALFHAAVLEVLDKLLGQTKFICLRLHL